MWTSDERRVLMQFLNRVPITGHQEREAMNHICHRLAYEEGEPVGGPDLEAQMRQATEN